MDDVQKQLLSEAAKVLTGEVSPQEALGEQPPAGDEPPAPTESPAPETEDEELGIDLTPTYSDEIEALTADDPDDEDDDEPAVEGDDPDDDDEPAVEDEFEDERVLAERRKTDKLQRRITKLEEERTEARREQWAVKHAEQFPFIDVVGLAKTCTTHREFLRKAKAANNQIAPLVESKVAQVLREHKDELKERWGVPAGDTASVPPEAAAAQADLEKARKSGSVLEIAKNFLSTGQIKI